MTNQSSTLTVAPGLSSQAIAARDRSERRKVTGRLKRALDLMVWEGLTDNQAAVHPTVKMHIVSIRNALNKHHVRAYLRAQRDVLLTREGPRNVHAMIEVRDQTSNQMARVAAAKALEQIDDLPSSAAQRVQAPGFIIQIVNGAGGEVTAKPLIQHDAALTQHERQWQIGADPIDEAGGKD